MDHPNSALGFPGHCVKPRRPCRLGWKEEKECRSKNGEKKKPVATNEQDPFNNREQLQVNLQNNWTKAQRAVQREFVSPSQGVV